MSGIGSEILCRPSNNTLGLSLELLKPYLSMIPRQGWSSLAPGHTFLKVTFMAYLKYIPLQNCVPVLVLHVLNRWPHYKGRKEGIGFYVAFNITCSSRIVLRDLSVAEGT